MSVAGTPNDLGPVLDPVLAPVLAPILERIARALERLAPPPSSLSLDGPDAFVWQPRPASLEPVTQVAALKLSLLRGIERQKATLLDNTARFAAGRPANNAMLWGARGTGKSSLVKAVHRALAEDPHVPTPALVEIERDDLATLPELLGILRRQSRRVIVFCDDLSFEVRDADYKALKTVLDGGLRGRPDNVLFYATSNRRHLMPRDMIENEQQGAINPGEAVEEKISLSDRFGLWLGFHAIDQATYLAMIEAYAREQGLTVPPATLRQQALEWATTRGARSGRVAFQFAQDLAGRT